MNAVVTRFKSDEQDLTIDWSSVEAIQKFRLGVNIYLKSGNVIKIMAPNDEWCNDCNETLYAQWEHSISCHTHS